MLHTKLSAFSLLRKLRFSARCRRNDPDSDADADVLLVLGRVDRRSVLDPFKDIRFFLTNGPVLVSIDMLTIMKSQATMNGYYYVR